MSDPEIHDCDRHGEDLLERIKELTQHCDAVDGWRPLLANAGMRIRQLESELLKAQWDLAEAKALRGFA